MKMETLQLLLFLCSVIFHPSLSTSSSAPNPYRSHFLDTFFSADLLAGKDPSKRNAGAQLSDLVSTYVKAGDSNHLPQPQFISQENDKVNTLGSPVSSYGQNTPAKNIYRGSSSLAYHGSPTPPPYSNPTPNPQSFIQPLVPESPAYQTFFQPTSPPVSYPATPASESLQPVTPYQTFFDSYPSIPQLSNSVDPDQPTVPDETSKVAIKPFTFFNLPSKQETQQSFLSQTIFQDSFSRDSLPKKQSASNLEISHSPDFTNLGNLGNNVRPSNIFSVFAPVQQQPLVLEPRQVQTQQQPIFSPLSLPPADPAHNEVTVDASNPRPYGPVQAQAPQIHISKSQSQPSLFESINQPSKQPSLYESINQPSSQPSLYESINQPSSQPSLYESINQPSSHPSLYESINQPAPDREVRQKLSGKPSQRRMPKSAALDQLMAIAGDNWEHKLLTGIDNLSADTSSSFLCPAPEGLFPSPSSCSVYYQCAQGTAHKHTCQGGLAWNTATDQCDWAESVQCGGSSP